MTGSGNETKKPAAAATPAPTSLLPQRLLATAMLRQARAEGSPVLEAAAKKLATHSAPKGKK